MAEVGQRAIVLTLAASACASGASFSAAQRGSISLVKRARGGAFLAAICSTVAVAVLVGLFVSRDYAAKYVYEHVNRHLPIAYRVSALWAGQGGSPLIWLWFTTLLAVVMVAREQGSGRNHGLCSAAVMSLVQAFLALVLLVGSNPFQTLPTAPAQGRGLNPLLKSFWMIVHPPVVFLGYAAYTVPFALALGGLITGQMGRDWLRVVRRWALLAWVFLGAGILLGARWAYLEMGWGGY